MNNYNVGAYRQIGGKELAVTGCRVQHFVSLRECGVQSHAYERRTRGKMT